MRDPELSEAWVSPLRIAVLWSFAVAQPLYDLLGRGPTFLVAHRVEGPGLFAFAAALSLLAPLLLSLPGRLLALLGAPGFAAALDGAITALLAGLVLLQLAGRFAGWMGPWALTALCAVGGLAVVGLTLRFRRARLFLVYLAPAVVIFPALFLAGAGGASLFGRARPSGAGAVRIGAPAPVVMVVFDEFALASLLDEAGGIDASRFPNLARFAAGSTWFRNATANYDVTELALPSLLTGRFAHESSTPNATDYPENLFTLLAGSYELHVQELVTHLCPAALCSSAAPEAAVSSLRQLGADLGIVYLHVALPDALRAPLPPIDQSWAGFGAPRARVDAERDEDAPALTDRDVHRSFDLLLRALASHTRPALYFVHQQLPHVPYQYLPSGREYGPPQGDFSPHGLLADGNWEDDEWQVVQAQQRYLLQVGYLDREVGELVRALRENGLYDRSLVILTADHGIAFHPGESRRVLGPETAGAILPIPLLVKLPEQSAGRVIDTNAELVDLLPTIAATLKAEDAWPMDGESLVDGGRPLRAKKVAISAGRQLSWPASLLPELTAESRRQADRFGFGGGFAPVLAIGSHRELLGRAVAEFARSGARGSEAALDYPRQYAQVTSSGAYVPAHVTGTLSAGSSTDLELAVAVDGTVRALTRPFGPQGRRRFTAMVPEESFSPGANRVELFAVVDEPAGRVALARLAGSESERAAADGGGAARTARARAETEYRLDELTLHDDEVIVTPTGRLPVVHRPGFGFVERLKIVAGLLDVSGWAGDTAQREPVERVLVFAGDELLFSWSPDRGRPDVAARFGSALELAGFRFGLPLADAATTVAAIRVFALSKSGLAVALPRTEDAADSRPRAVPAELALELSAAGAPLAVNEPGRGRIVVRAGALSGYVERLELRSGTIQLSGWAAQADSGQPARRILLFWRGRCLGLGTTGGERADIAQALAQPAASAAGFELSAAFPGDAAELREMQVLALSSGDEATELAWLGRPR